jgi:hypothetical protein
VGLLAVEILLWLFDHFGWFGFNKREGRTVLIAVAGAGLAIVLMLICFAVGLTLRWRFQFSLRALLVLVVAFAVPCSWLAAKKRQSVRQREAVAAILHLGGRVMYDFEYPPPAPGETSSRVIEPPGPAWLRNLLGINFLAAVVQVTLDSGSRGRFTDADMRHVQALTGLQDLILDNTGVSDLGLEQLTGLSRLRKLWLSGARFTDAGMECLSRLQGLEELYLWGTQLTDAGLQSLAKSKTLRQLEFNSTRITAEGERLFRQSVPNRRIDRWISPE